MNIKKIVNYILFVLLLSSCAHSVHLNYTSDFSPSFKNYTEGKMVHARSEQLVIMGMVGNTNYVEEAYQKIQADCPNGNLQGVNTQFATALGFLSWTNSIDIRALCIN